MRAAYDYAEQPRNDDGTFQPVPLELEIAWRCNDLGADAVLGEGAPARVVRRVALSNSVYRAFISRRDYRDENGAENWTEWARKYPDQNRMLIAALGESDG